MAQENVKKLIGFAPQMTEMVEQLQSEMGLPSFTAVIHQAVVSLWDKKHPSYANVNPLAKDKDKVNEIRDKKKLKEQAAREEKLEIVEKLGGELIVDEEKGIEVCRYYTYTSGKRYLQEVSLSMLSMDIVKNQYFPSKEAVLKLQEEGKTNY